MGSSTSTDVHTDPQLLSMAMTWPRCFLNPHCQLVVRDVCDLVKREVRRPMLVSIGGIVGGEVTDQVLSLDLGAAPKWVAEDQLSPPLYFLAAVSLGGQATVVGGLASSGPTAQVRLWSPRSNVWRSGSTLYDERYHHTATVIAGEVVVVCGGLGASNSVEVLRPGASQWTVGGRMEFNLHGHAATCPRTDPTKVVMMGGRQNGISAATHCYDAESDRWDSSLPAMSEGRHGLRAVALGDGCSYAVGGCHGHVNTFSLVERLDLRTPEWRVVSPLPEGRYRHAAAVLDEWSFVVSGGVGGDNCGTSTVFVYDSRADRWSDRPEWALPCPVAYHGVVNVHA